MFEDGTLETYEYGAIMFRTMDWSTVSDLKPEVDVVIADPAAEEITLLRLLEYPLQSLVLTVGIVNVFLGIDGGTRGVE